MDYNLSLYNDLCCKALVENVPNCFTNFSYIIENDNIHDVWQNNLSEPRIFNMIVSDSAFNKFLKQNGNEFAIYINKNLKKIAKLINIREKDIKFPFYIKDILIKTNNQLFAIELLFICFVGNYNVNKITLFTINNIISYFPRFQLYTDIYN